MAARWTLDDIPWDQFDPGKVDPEIVKIVKAASMVESNGHHYAAYLHHVFPGDREFCGLADAWAEEEVQHGLALGRWAKLADPAFDYEERLAAFREGFKIPITVASSVRGSRAGEMVARCMVEVGTSSYYTALADAVEEPVLKAICRRIAADELRHYMLFYKTLRRYLDADRLNRLQRLRVALGRIMETEDDELACAYYYANKIDGPYDRGANTKAYMRRAYALYRPRHLERAIAMILKAVGLEPTGRLNRVLTRAATWLMERRLRRLASA